MEHDARIDLNAWETWANCNEQAVLETIGELRHRIELQALAKLYKARVIQDDSQLSALNLDKIAFAWVQPQTSSNLFGKLIEFDLDDAEERREALEQLLEVLRRIFHPKHGEVECSVAFVKPEDLPLLQWQGDICRMAVRDFLQSHAEAEFSAGLNTRA